MSQEPAQPSGHDTVWNHLMADLFMSPLTNMLNQALSFSGDGKRKAEPEIF